MLTGNIYLRVRCFGTFPPSLAEPPREPDVKLLTAGDANGGGKGGGNGRRASVSKSQSRSGNMVRPSA